MITKDQALALRKGDRVHAGKCEVRIGSRGGVRYGIKEWRINGQAKTWKTRPTHFSVPIKHGLYQYHYLDHDNAWLFHLPSDCPALKEAGG